jgi:periplasmic protein TonB
MFEQCLLSNGKTRRPWTVLVAFAGQLLAIGILLASPFFFIEAPPVTQLTAMLLAPPLPPPPPPPAAPPQASAPKETHTASRKFDASQLIAPRTIPKQVATIKDLEMAPPSAGGVIGGVPGGVPGGVVVGVIGGLLIAAPPPPPPPPQKAELPKTPERIRKGGNVQAALLIHEVDPAYPKLAREARIGGVVELRAIIGTDGTVQNLVLVSGQVLLVQAAMDAVKQWVYKPTYLNGVPVEVVTEVSVHFYLSS